MPISQTKTFLKFRDASLKKGLGFFEKDSGFFYAPFIYKKDLCSCERRAKVCACYASAVIMRSVLLQWESNTYVYAAVGVIQWDVLF